MQEPGGSGNRDNTSIPHTHSRIQRNLKDGLGLPGLGTGVWVKSRRSPRASESHSQLGGVQSMKRRQQLQRRAPTPGLTQTDPDDASWSPPPDGERRRTTPSRLPLCWLPLSGPRATSASTCVVTPPPGISPAHNLNLSLQPMNYSSFQTESSQDKGWPHRHCRRPGHPD